VGAVSHRFNFLNLIHLVIMPEGKGYLRVGSRSKYFSYKWMRIGVEKVSQ